MQRTQRIIGYRRNGCPIWQIMGAAPDDDSGEGDGSGGDDPAEADGSEGDAGGGEDDQVRDPKALLKAYRAEKTKVTTEKDKRQQAQSELKQFKDLGYTPKQLSELAAAQKKQDGDGSLEELKRQAKTEAQAELLKDRALDKIEVKAAQTFADSEDARRFLADRVDEFVDDGKIDADAIGEALDELAKNKPYLAAQSGKKFQGNGDGGARQSKPARPKSISEAVGKKYS